MSDTAKRVLVAEDNPGLARVLQFNLQHAGLDVVVASDGTQAWQLASNHAFDSIITDHEMPGMTGVELCERIRQLSDHAETPLIMVTAKGLELDVERIKKTLGLAALYPKPYSPSELVAAVQELLAAAS